MTDSRVWVVLAWTITGGHLVRMVGGVFSTEQRARTFAESCLPFTQPEIDCLVLDEERP